MARDDHSIARAGVCGAAGTVSMSASVSLYAAAITAAKAPSGWPLCFMIGGFGVAIVLWLLAAKFWFHGWNPKPPRIGLKANGTPEIAKAWLGKYYDFPTFGSAFLQDARDGRHKIWGRYDEEIKATELMRNEYLHLPLVFIPREYWTDAKIDWYLNTTKPNDPSEVIYRCLILRKQRFMLTVMRDRIRGRFK